MAVTSRINLKEYFQTGDKPTQAQFVDLIDSFVHIDESSLSNIILEDLHVSGNIIPSTPSDGFTSSFSLGSPEAAWKDLYVSEDSVKFIKKSNSGTSEELARITIDTGSGIMKFAGPTDNKDVELRQTQFGKDTQKGAFINDGGGALGTDVRLSMQSKELGINGGAMVVRPEMQDLSYLGRDFVAHTFQSKGSGSIAMLIDADSTNGNDSFFRVEQGGIAGVGTKLFTVKKDKSTFGNKVKFESSIVATGGSVIEEGIIVQPGIISQSFSIGTTTSPSLNTMTGIGNNCIIEIAEGVTVAVNLNSTLQIQCPPPDVTADSNTGTITLSDPTINGGGDVIIYNNNNGNPTTVSQNTTIPSGQVSYWTVGDIENELGIRINEGFSLKIEEGATLYIQNPQPDVTVNTEEDTITLSNGTGDETSFTTGQFGTNPQMIPMHMVVPSNQIAVWYGPIYVGRFTLNPLGTEFNPNGAGVLNMDLAGQGNNASLRIQNGSQIKVHAF